MEIKNEINTRYKTYVCTKNNTSGVTLIALIVIIIILLILAGVVVNLSIKENGIINNAKVAKEKTNIETATEKINLKITNSQMNSYAKNQRMSTLQELADDFCEDNEIEYVELKSKKIASLDKIEIGENTSFFTKLKDYPYEFEINSSLLIASIDGVSTNYNTEMVSKEEYDELQERYNLLLEQYNSLKVKNLTWVSSSRNGCTIPSGVTEAYVIFCSGTNSSNLNASISGSIIESQNIIAYISNVDNYGSNLRTSLWIYKLKLTGLEGNIAISATGGAGTLRAWTAMIMY